MTTPSDLLNAAITIKSTMLDETGQRTCINRAYYAVYHAANEIDERLQLSDPAVPVKGSHQRLFNRLTNCLPSQSANYLVAKSLGYSASKLLKPYRQHADYRITDPIPNNMSEEAIAKSALLLAKAATI